MVVSISLYTKDWSKVILFLKKAGWGPGSYYLYVYAQLWFLMPWIYSILTLRKKPYIGIALIFFISLALNMVCNLFQPSDGVYRLLFVRYLFLSVMAFVWLKWEIKWYYLLILSLISVCYWYFFNSSFGILTYKGDWAIQNWPAFFYTLLFVKILIKLYGLIQNSRFAVLLCSMGRDSWLIFLSQMFILGFVSFNKVFAPCMRHFLCMNSVILQRLLFILFAFAASIILARVLKVLLSKVLERIQI